MEAPSPDRPYTAAVITLSDKGVKRRAGRTKAARRSVNWQKRPEKYQIRETLLLADGIEPLKSQLIRLADQRQMDVIFTTGGTRILRTGSDAGSHDPGLRPDGKRHRGRHP